MKIIYSSLTTLCFLSFSVLHAQPKIRQQKVIGSYDFDQSTCMILTKDGGYLLGGYTSSAAGFEKTENSKGGDDYWIVKLDSSRNVMWDNTIGGSGTDQLYSMQQTSDNGYILCGSSMSSISGDKTARKKGYDDIWIVKLDSLGNTQWDKTISAYSTNSPKIQLTKDGGYILGCSTTSGIRYDKTDSSRGGYDYWIVKLNAAGKIVWDKTIGGNGEDQFADIKQTPDLGYVVAGTSSSDMSSEKTANSKGTNDYWIVKLSTTGNVEWDKTIGGSYDDRLTSIDITSDNGLILGGYSSSPLSGDKTKDVIGQNRAYDYWIVKLDSNANIEWDRTFGGVQTDLLTKIKQTTHGGYIIGGYSYSGNLSGIKTETNRGPFGTDDYWVIGVNKEGRYVWDKTIGGAGNDALSDLVEIKVNRYALLGSSGSYADGDKTITRHGYTDFWFVELQYIRTNTIIAAMNENNITSPKNNQPKFVAYPNPAKNILYVNCSSAAVVTLIDMQGKLLLSKTINGNATIDVSKYTPGTYFLKNNTTGQVEKIIITGK